MRRNVSKFLHILQPAVGTSIIEYKSSSNILLWALILQFGKVADYAHRTEFQKRGSPHTHGLLWVDSAPKFGISSDKEICNYIDSCISCSLAVGEEEKPFVKFQIHKHSPTCKKVVKRKPICRFGIPWPPMQETRILYPLEIENTDEISALQENYKSLMS